MFGIAFEVTNHAARFGLGCAARYAGWRVFDRIAGYMPYQGFVLPASRAHGRKAPAAANGFICREVELAELRAYARDPALRPQRALSLGGEGAGRLLFKAVTQPEWRGQGLHGRQLPVILRKFSGTAGFKGLTTLVWATNYPSLSSFKRLYFEPAFRFVIAGKGAKRRLLADTPGLANRADGGLFFRPAGLNETFAVIRLEGV